jgi:lipoprotein-anchoring transpeptidase ErfK/SrfK
MNRHITRHRPGTRRPAYAPQGYAAPNQADPRDGPIDPRFLR